jgi:hypothetical protein
MGSTQSFGVAAESQRYPVPVFFAPPAEGTEINPYWGSLLLGTVRAFYTFVAGGLTPAQIGPAAAIKDLSWDRLKLELMRIASFEGNWDGEGAEAIPQEAIKAATVLLSLAQAAMERSAVEQGPLPTLIPAVEGGIIFKWACGKRELKCTILDNIVEVIRWRSPERYESDGLWEIPALGVAEHFEWLLQQ